MAARVTRIAATREGRSSRVAVELDGARWLTLDAADAARLGLAVGDEVDADLQVAAEEAARRAAALAQAARLLARRSRSSAELDRAVGGRHGEEVAAEVVTTLAGHGLVDDARHAAQVVEHLLGRGWGPLRILHDLEQAGVGAELAAAALAGAGEEGVEDAARFAARGRVGAAAYARILARGFDEETALRVAGDPFDDADAADVVDDTGA